MVTYKMREQFGAVCGDGSLAIAFLNSIVLPSLELDECVQLDFDGVRVINSSFSNALFGNLLRFKGRSVLASLTITNARPIVKSEIKSGISFGLMGGLNQFVAA